MAGAHEHATVHRLHERVKGELEQDAGERGLERRRREIAKLEEQMRQVKVDDLILQTVASLVNLTARRIAKPDERWTERPLACVVCREGARPTAGELRAHLEPLRFELARDLGDVFGHRRMFIIGAAIFGLGSLLASVSTSVPTLFLGEALQLKQQGAGDRLEEVFIEVPRVREDAGFHAYQMLEAGVRQFNEWGNSNEGRHILIAVARYLAAHSPTKRAALQTADIARRLLRGGELHQEATA